MRVLRSAAFHPLVVPEVLTSILLHSLDCCWPRFHESVSQVRQILHMNSQIRVIAHVVIVGRRKRKIGFVW